MGAAVHNETSIGSPAPGPTSAAQHRAEDKVLMGLVCAAAVLVVGILSGCQGCQERRGPGRSTVLKKGTWHVVTCPCSLCQPQNGYFKHQDVNQEDFVDYSVYNLCNFSSLHWCDLDSGLKYSNFRLSTYLARLDFSFSHSGRVAASISRTVLLILLLLYIPVWCDS